MEILIGKGLDDLQFGLLESQVIEILGQPDKVYELDGSRRLQFFERLLEVAFEYENENRFGWLEVKNPDAMLLGHKLIGAKVETVLPIVATAISETPEHTDYNSFENYFFNSYWLELQFEMGRLRSINLGVLWNADDHPQWLS